MNAVKGSRGSFGVSDHSLKTTGLPTSHFSVDCKEELVQGRDEPEMTAHRTTYWHELQLGVCCFCCEATHREFSYSFHRTLSQTLCCSMWGFPLSIYTMSSVWPYLSHTRCPWCPEVNLRRQTRFYRTAFDQSLIEQLLMGVSWVASPWSPFLLVTVGFISPGYGSCSQYPAMLTFPLSSHLFLLTLSLTWVPFLLHL